jgi:ARG/rhodanese/phosphatase superfamily protein
VKFLLFTTFFGFAVIWGGMAAAPSRAAAGEIASSTDYKVLAPIHQGNLTVFPVVVSSSRDTHEFLTLDEGLRSGEVVVTESGSVQPLIRRRTRTTPVHEGAQVNQLVLVNNSKRPLVLLAGEIVTGGKQDRVIAKDRIVPAESEPVDLGVFCVEPGRWVAKSANFGALGGNMAAPSVRLRAMKDKDQQQVWDSVRSAQTNIEKEVPRAAAEQVEVTSSYAGVMENVEVQRKLDKVAAPIERDYSKLIHELRDRNAVGVVVAVDGEIIWADIFASTQLLEKYWPKLVRSYATEALVSRAADREVDLKHAQAFIDQLDGNHETVEREPGLYRHTEVNGDGYKVFVLASLLPKMGFDVHIAKMAE